MGTERNSVSDTAKYHEIIDLFAELNNLDYNPIEMLVTVVRNGKTIYKKPTEVAVGKSRYDYTSVFKDISIFFSDKDRQGLQLYIGQDPHYNKFEFDLASKTLIITTTDNTTIKISNN